MSFTNEVELLSKKRVSENVFTGWGLSGFRSIKQQGDFSTPIFVVCYHRANPALKLPLSRDNVKQTLLCMTRPCLVKSRIAFPPYLLATIGYVQGKPTALSTR